MDGVSAFASAMVGAIAESADRLACQRAAMKGAPPAILRRKSWSLWRRMLFIPTLADQDRIDAWQFLVRAFTDQPRFHGPEVFAPRRTGIFGPSRVYWNHLQMTSERGLRGFRLVDGRPEVDHLLIPHGPLVHEHLVEEYACAITEVEGISASKSEKRHFDSVADFGKDYATYLRIEASPEVLGVMLAHREVRVMHNPPTDRLSLGLWDGRLFIANAGGSHHLAAAIWMSRLLDIPVRVRPKLSVRWLNERAWRWMIQTFVPLLVPVGGQTWSPFDGARVTGSWYWLGLPVPESCELHLVPRAAPATAEVIGAATAAGLCDLTDAIASLLATQQHWSKLWQQRLLDVRFDGIGE